MKTEREVVQAAIGKIKELRHELWWANLRIEKFIEDGETFRRKQEDYRQAYLRCVKSYENMCEQANLHLNNYAASFVLNVLLIIALAGALMAR